MEQETNQGQILNKFGRMVWEEMLKEDRMMARIVQLEQQLKDCQSKNKEGRNP